MKNTRRYALPGLGAIALAALLVIAVIDYLPDTLIADVPDNVTSLVMGIATLAASGSIGADLSARAAAKKVDVAATVKSLITVAGQLRKTEPNPEPDHQP